MSSEKYDEDAKVLGSVSDIGSDTDSDGETIVQSPNDKGKDVLDDHDEAERLLIAEGSRSKLGGKSKAWAYNVDQAKPQSRRPFRMKRRHSTANEEASDLVYEMEEGYKDSSSNTSTESLLLGKTQYQKSKTTSASCARITIMSISIAALFAILAYGAYRASNFTRLHVTKSYSNGTHVFGATTILISLDGFRADFLQRGLTPSLNAFAASGVSPKYMLPSFPTVTFPNHYTLVTGLYPESHGIVGNQFWDPAFQEEFYYTNLTSSMQPKWWSSAEPLWVTAEKAGVKTAIHMWPGSEAHILGVEPTYLDKFSAFEQLPSKVDRILGLLDMKQDERPQLIAAYVPDVDRDGHKYGPNSTEIRATIASADNMLTLLIEGLLKRNLTEIVNLVVVSDHGMATMSAHRMVQLDDLIDLSLVDHIDGWPLRGLRLKNAERDVPIMHEQLSKAAKEHGTFDVYMLDTMPERYHFSNNPRIAPLWVVPKTGWLVIEREEFNIAEAIEAGEEFHPRGIHGFDHEHPLMRAIFIARGPAFPHPPNSRIPVFQNIEVYNIVCGSLGIKPHNNNGTFQLPLKTEGLHDDFDDAESSPDDDPAYIHEGTGTTGDTAPDGIDIPDSASRPEDASKSSGTSGSPDDLPPSTKGRWWKYLHETLDKAKEWAKQLIDSIKNNKEPAGKADAG